MLHLRLSFVSQNDIGLETNALDFFIKLFFILRKTCADLGMYFSYPTDKNKTICNGLGLNTIIKDENQKTLEKARQF